MGLWGPWPTNPRPSSGWPTLTTPGAPGTRARGQGLRAEGQGLRAEALRLAAPGYPEVLEKFGMVFEVVGV